MLIVLEGLDGAGKSTQVELVRRMFAQEGVESHFLHFPRFDAPVYGELIARFLRGELGAVDKVDPYLVALLFAGDRADALPRSCAVGSMRATPSCSTGMSIRTWGSSAPNCLPGTGRRSCGGGSSTWSSAITEFPVRTCRCFWMCLSPLRRKKLSEVREGDDREYRKGNATSMRHRSTCSVVCGRFTVQPAAADDRLRIIDCSDAQGGMDSPNAIFARIRTEIERFR